MLVPRISAVLVLSAAPPRLVMLRIARFANIVYLKAKLRFAGALQGSCVSPTELKAGLRPAQSFALQASEARLYSKNIEQLRCLAHTNLRSKLVCAEGAKPSAIC